MKKCSTCGIEKDETDFHRHKKAKDGLQVYCKACRKSTDSSRNWKEYDIKRKYGITLAELSQLVEDQDHKCAICGAELADDRFTHVDHCHASGKVRGVLCHNCNIGLGHFRDDIGLLASAIQYLNTTKEI